MSASVADLVASVLTEGNFDATQMQVLAWLNARHELMCARTRCYRRKIEVGPTVAEQQSYVLPKEVLEIREVVVQSPESADLGGLGVPYGAGLHRDLAQGALGYLWLGGVYQRAGGGIYVRDENGDGKDLLALYPAPTEGGLAVSVFAVCRAEPLTLGVVEGLVVGSAATLRFNFTDRALTEAEQQTFDASGDLPAGVGVDPAVVRLTYTLPGAAPVTVEGADVVREAQGSYSVSVTPAVLGALLWEGLGFNAEGAQTNSTGPLETAIVGVSGLKTPPEFNDALIAGAVATGLARLEARPDLAQEGNSVFAAACQELEAQVNKRYRGSGAATIRVRGVNA